MIAHNSDFELVLNLTVSIMKRKKLRSMTSFHGRKGTILHKKVYLSRNFPAICQKYKVLVRSVGLCTGLDQE